MKGHDILNQDYIFLNNVVPNTKTKLNSCDLIYPIYILYEYSLGGRVPKQRTVTIWWDL